MYMYGISNESDASIKTVDNVNINSNGYSFKNKTMIGYNITNTSFGNSGLYWLYELNSKIWCSIIFLSDTSCQLTSCTATIIYI